MSNRTTPWYSRSVDAAYGGKPDVRDAFVKRFGAVVPPFPGAEAAIRRLLDTLEVRIVAVSDHPSLALFEGIASERGFEVLPLERAEHAEVIVCGSCAVTLRGKRCGSGRGTTDLAFGILRERGVAPIPVATVVDDEQIVDFFPTYEHDVDLTLIATPTKLHEVAGPLYAPAGVRWDWLEPHHFEARPDLTPPPGARTTRR